MNRIFLLRGLVSALIEKPWDGPHLQRLAERWLRRWGFALAGLALGLGGMWLLRPEVSEAHASGVQAVARLEQQLASMPSGTPAQTLAKAFANTAQSITHTQGLWRGLPAWTPPENVWTTWQQALVAQGLRLQYLQPMPPNHSEGRSGALVAHVAAWRVLGRFDDWVRVWSACAESGPVCTLERINVVATDKPAEVQIDGVMRVWMHPSEMPAALGAERGEAPSPPEDVQAHWMLDVRTGLQPSGRSRVALFALNPGASAVAEGAGLADPAAPAKNTEGASAAVASLAVLSDDPHQWPFARVRLAGLWQQGGERQAVLSAGPHAVRVLAGQRVTLEGHQVVAITDAGVRLRLGKGPLLQLAWADALQVGALHSPSAGQVADPPTQAGTNASTTERQEK